MQVTVKLSAREGAAHVSGILAGFTLLAKRGELTLRVQDERQGSPLAREALLETEIDGRTATSTTTRRRCWRCSNGQMWCSNVLFQPKRTGSSRAISPQSCGHWG